MLLPLLLLTWAPAPWPRVQAPEPGAAAEAPGAPAPSVEDEVRRYVLDQPIGPGSVADLALPDAFVDRVVDRIVRSSFDERIGIVMKDEVAPGDEAATDEAVPDRPGELGEDAPSPLYPIGYAALALALAAWFALRARRGTA